MNVQKNYKYIKDEKIKIEKCLNCEILISKTIIIGKKKNSDRVKKNISQQVITEYNMTLCIQCRTIGNNLDISISLLNDIIEDEKRSGIFNSRTREVHSLLVNSRKLVHTIYINRRKYMYEEREIKRLLSTTYIRRKFEHVYGDQISYVETNEYLNNEINPLQKMEKYDDEDVLYGTVKSDGNIIWKKKIKGVYVIVDKEGKLIPEEEI